MKKRYSKYIIPISILVTLLIINSAIVFISDDNYTSPSFILYINSTWLLISYFTKFFKESRTTKVIKIIGQLLSQFFLFFLAYFAFFGIFKEGQMVDNQLKVFLIIFIGITLFKFVYFYLLKLYRKGGLNFRNVVVIGIDPTTEKIAEVFDTKNYFGYRFKGFFSEKESNSKNYLGAVADSYSYIITNEIDEIYCALTSLDNAQTSELREFARENNIKLNFIPNSRELYNKNFSLEYYDIIPVLKVKELPFDTVETRIVKRIFDVLFSIFIIVFLLSWMIPIIGFLIVLESRGPVFFKQQRRGLDGEGFNCLKFRSMHLNKFSDDIHTIKNDNRITRIGSFLRKTSLDELPQFFNVLMGDMSVVGPRPHMKKQSLKFEKEIANYFARNAVKPGITGLAQTRGFRGEIIEKSDIENRVRLDVFYIENWSFLLDIKIIIDTIFNAFIGEEKAY